jgi:hypothetical protein
VEEDVRANLARAEILLGRDEPGPAPRPLRAGPLRLEFEGTDLRYARAGDTEVLRRVYFALRDRDWNTIPAEVTRQVVERAADSFRIVQDAHHRADGIDFDATTTLEGRPDGTIECSFDGTAHVGFPYCRIGFCILHPVAVTAGRPFRADAPAGAFSGVIPAEIGPQPEVDGCFLPLFDSFSALAVELPRGGEARFEFEGDLFEMEDQRNWTDGSFKTYSPPASLGTPFHAAAGQSFHQRIRFRVVGGGATVRPRDAAPRRLTIGGRVAALPAIGFGMSSVSDELTEREAGLLRALRPAHLHADLHLARPAWRAELDRAAAAATAVGCRMELGLFVDDEAEAEFAALAGSVRGLPVARAIVFHDAEASVASTTARWMTLARAALDDVLPGVLLAGGTTGNFAEINRDRPDPAAYDQLVYAVTPQVHLSDERSLTEGIDAQGDTVRTAATFMGGRPIVISSVTLKPPFNQAASDPAPATAPTGDLPPEVDPRQPSLFAAAWTIGSIRSLAAAGAASITYYETVGWRGLVESAGGPPVPAAFRSRPGMVFPVYHAFRWLADAAGGDVLATMSDRPLELDGLALRIDGVLRVIVANLTPERLSCRIGPLGPSLMTVRRLNADTARLAWWEPDLLESLPSAVAVRSGTVDLELDAYEVVRLDEGRAAR